MVSLPGIYTIGVYGRTEHDFFKNLVENKIDTFCDIRRRRAVRGAEYAYANSERLQQKLAKLSIRYLYEIKLAPTKELIDLQANFDRTHKTQRRKREELSDVFRKAYSDKILAHADIKQFITHLEKGGAKKIAFFCVEKSPVACHRSLVTQRIQELFPEISISHL